MSGRVTGQVEHVEVEAVEPERLAAGEPDGVLHGRVDVLHPATPPVHVEQRLHGDAFAEQQPAGGHQHRTVGRHLRQVGLSDEDRGPRARLQLRR